MERHPAAYGINHSILSAAIPLQGEGWVAPPQRWGGGGMERNRPFAAPQPAVRPSPPTPQTGAGLAAASAASRGRGPARLPQGAPPVGPAGLGGRRRSPWEGRAEAARPRGRGGLAAPALDWRRRAPPRHAHTGHGGKRGERPTEVGRADSSARLVCASARVVRTCRYLYRRGMLGSLSSTESQTRCTCAESSSGESASSSAESESICRRTASERMRACTGL